MSTSLVLVGGFYQSVFMLQIQTSQGLDWIWQGLVELLLALYLVVIKKALQPGTLHVLSYFMNKELSLASDLVFCVVFTSCSYLLGSGYLLGTRSPPLGVHLVLHNITNYACEHFGLKKIYYIQLKEEMDFSLTFSFQKIMQKPTIQEKCASSNSSTLSYAHSMNYFFQQKNEKSP